MVSLLLPVIYLAFISLGLPDALLGRGVAQHVSAARRGRVLGGRRVHDHLRRDHRVQPCKRAAQQ